MLFSVTGKKVIPDCTGNDDNNPVQRTEEKALDRVPIFVDTKTAAFTRTAGAEKNEDTQRQSPAISGQIGNDAVAKLFAVESLAAAEEYQQAGKVGR